MRRGSFSRIRDAEEPHWRSSVTECWVASDASAVVEHTKRWGRGDCAGCSLELWGRA
jgi:hypothetical protein